MPLNIEQGDIFYVTLTGYGKVITGRRPCIVMSRLSVNNAGETVVIVPLTTQGDPNPYYRIRIPATEISKDPSCTTTVENSIAKCDHARVIDKKLLEQKFGKLSHTATIAVGLGLSFVFDLR